MSELLIKPGFLEMFVGPMRSGKTRELINFVDKLNFIEGCKYSFYKPKIDTRSIRIRSRFGNLSYDCNVVDSPEEILSMVADEDLVIIDEAQFFGEELVGVVKLLQKKGCHVVVSGLDLDFRGEPFGPVPFLLALADRVHKLFAVCDFPGCKELANRTQRLVDGKPARYDSPTILVGDEKEGYEARCLKHHEVIRD